MPIYPIIFIIIFVIGAIAALVKGPIYGLMLYVFVYYNIPKFHWWGGYIPDLRWSLTTVGILLFSCFIHYKQLEPHKSSMNAPLKVLIVLLFLMAAIIPISYDSEISFNRVYDFFRYVLMFYIIGRIITDFEKFQHLVLIIIICSIHLFWTAHYYFDGNRLDGVGLPDASDANFFAILIIIIIPLIVALLLTGKTWQKIIAIAGLPLAINAFAMTRSRGPFIGLLVQLIMAIILFRNSKYRIKIFSGVICVIVLFGILMDDQFIARLQNMKDDVTQGESSRASAGRMDVWKYGFQMFRDYPLGAGGGSFMALSPTYLPEEMLIRKSGQKASHNTYLLILVEQGVVGLIIYFVFMFFTIYTAFKILAKESTIENKTEVSTVYFYATMLIIILCGFWTASFFGDRLYFEGFYLIAALVPVLHRINRRSSKNYNIEQNTDQFKIIADK